MFSPLVFLIIRLHAIFEMRRRILFVTVPFGLLTIVLSSVRFPINQSSKFICLDRQSYPQLALGTAEILTVSLTGRGAGTAEWGFPFYIPQFASISWLHNLWSGHSDSLHVPSFGFPTPNFSRNGEWRSHRHSEIRLDTESDSLSLYRMSYIANISFDTLVFILAIFKMGRMRSGGLLYRSQSSIVWVLFRDGEFRNISSLIFLIMLLQGITLYA